VEIARQQLALEDEMLRQYHDSQVLICDTCVLTTWIWSEFLVKKQAEELRQLMEARERSYDLYVLMDIDVCWIDDGTRLAPDTKWFHDRCVSFIQLRGVCPVTCAQRGGVLTPLFCPPFSRIDFWMSYAIEAYHLLLYPGRNGSCEQMRQFTKSASWLLQSNP
jgi:hypothetical protein